MTEAPGSRHLFVLATGQDTGGWGIRIKAGIDRHAPGWTARSMATTRMYLDYPTDLPFRRELARAHYGQADVVQLRNTLHGWQLYDDGAGKPVVLLYHGSQYRRDHAQLAAEAREIGALQIVSTMDLTLIEGDATWVGSPYNLAELRAIRAQHYRPDGRIRIAHAPTNRAIKGTEHFLQVVRRLQARHPVELVLIEQERWATCLRRKATADIFYDQLELGYGNNAIEAWAMGIPVVAGAADPAVRAAMRRRWGRLPFQQTTPDQLEARLEALITSERARQEWAHAGTEHVERWHDERVVIPQLLEIYSAALPTQPGPVHATRDRAGRRAARALRAQQSLERALAQRAAGRAARVAG